MTLREFFNAWVGWQEHQADQFKSKRNITFAAARYLAANSAWSKEDARRIANASFPWERKKSKVSIHDQLGSFVRRQEIKAIKRGDIEKRYG